MSIRDLNLEIGTVSRDAGRHTGYAGPQATFADPTFVNDGDYSTKATIQNGDDGTWNEYLKADLGAEYEVSSYLISVGNGPAMLVGFEYSIDGSSWTVLTGSEVGGRSTNPGATFTFTTPIVARYWAVHVQATGSHGSCEFNTWGIFGEEPAGPTPVAAFTGSPVSGFSPLTVRFIDESLNDPTSWLWDFGDGTTSTEQNPIHVYDIGVYDVTLTATNGSGSDSITETEYIVVRMTSPYIRDRLLLLIRASFTDERLANHALVVATGNKAQIYYGEVSDTDPDSPTRIDAIGDRVVRLESDLITTQQTADKAALKLFLDNCLISEDISLDAICIPAFEGNDVIGVQELDFSGIERNFRLQSFNIPLTTSRQSMKVSRVINLETQTVSVNDDIVLVASSQAIKSTAGTGVVIDAPVGVLSGDLLLIWAALDNGPGDTNPAVSGFASVSGSNRWKKKIATGSEPSTYSVSWSGSRRGVVTMFAYRNVDQVNPIAKLVTSTGSDDKTVTVPGMTLASGEYHLLVGVQANRGDVTYTFPAGWTELEEADTGGSTSAHVAISTADKPRIGSNPPSLNVTATLSTYETRFQIALRKDIS